MIDIKRKDDGKMAELDFEYITSEAVQKLMERGEEIQIIDVREEDEYRAGHIKGAKLVPLSKFRLKYEEIDPDKEAVLVCHSGTRSANACVFLSSMGYSKIKSLSGGMMKWRGLVEK